MIISSSTFSKTRKAVTAPVFISARVLWCVFMAVSAVSPRTLVGAGNLAANSTDSDTALKVDLSSDRLHFERGNSTFWKTIERRGVAG